MTIEVAYYDSPDQLVLDPAGLYLIFGYGTGDTFNAMIHLCKAPPLREYELIVKRPQLNLIFFLLGVYSRRPVRIHVVDHWKHDFSVRVAQRFPALGFVRGVEPNSTRSGFLDCWHHLFNYDKIIPLTDADVAALRAYFGAVPPARPLPDGAAILFPTAGENFKDYLPDWSRLAAQLKEHGVEHVYANRSGVANYGDETIAGAEPIDLSHEELIRTAYQPGHRLRLLAVRSGAMDILRFSAARALVLYQPVPTGIFQTCRFGLLRHNLDLIEAICLNDSKEHQDHILEYYIREFLAPSLEFRHER